VDDGSRLFGVLAVAAPTAAASGAVAPPVWGPRGGGGRGREVGGKWGGLDPILPITSEDILNSIDVFYGFSDSAPIRNHLVRAAVGARAVCLSVGSGAACSHAALGGQAAIASKGSGGS
jgi:hypothetical protein